jgi:hypothetical protein
MSLSLSNKFKYYSLCTQNTSLILFSYIKSFSTHKIIFMKTGY